MSYMSFCVYNFHPIDSGIKAISWHTKEILNRQPKQPSLPGCQSIFSDGSAAKVISWTSVRDSSSFLQ